MNLEGIKNKKIRSIYYQDELGGIGLDNKSKQFHLIQYGTMFLDFTDDSLIEIVNATEKGVIELIEINNSYKQELRNNIVEKDTYWSSISNKVISSLNTFSSILLISEKNSSKAQRREFISTIELIFKNGERIYLSNAGYKNADEVIAMTDDFIIYRNRKIGEELNIITEKTKVHCF